MSGRTREPDFERRLDRLREEASAHGRPDPAAGSSLPYPVASADHGYYGSPVLKAPVWTWEVPAYFVAGGTAGAAAVVAAFAEASGRRDLASDARWIAAAGAALSPPLLVSDLGRPERFLNMLRVFKLQSPMSVGAWTLVAFSTASGASAFAGLAARALPHGTPVRVLRGAADALAASTGVIMASYTGVLIGATAIPVWSRNVSMLPLHFSASSLATAASALELAGHRDRALHWLATAAAIVETAVGLAIEARSDPAFAPLKDGDSGTLVRLGGALSGPLPLALRVLGSRSIALRRLAAVSAIAGSVITRYGWVLAGRHSAEKAGRD